MRSTFLVALVPVLAAPAFAQSPTPMSSPRARWVATGATGTPTQRRDNQGAAGSSKMYVFGGRSSNAGTTVLNGLFEFDPVGLSWTTKTADAAVGSPPGRGGAAVAWNPVTSKLMVFGGDTGTSTTPNNQLLGDTWEWDPVTNAWTDITPVTSPSPRRFVTMCYEPVLGGMLMFGGEAAITTPATAPSNETWVWVAGSWVAMSPATTPPARRMASVVHRPDFNDVFMCLGDDPSTTPQTRLLDTWRWNGSNWFNITNPVFPAGTFPHGTTANTAVYDPLRQKVVVQGGQGISVPNTAGGGQYGDLYGGSPSTWCSEFDCLTNTWSLFGQAAFGTNDPLIGRTSRYYSAFVPATGKIYKATGQPNGGTLNACEYQATPVASNTPTAPLCTGSGGLMTLTANNLPWLNTTYSLNATGMAALSYNLGFAGFGTQSVPINSVLPQGIPGCLVLQTLDLEFFVGIGSSATWNIALPNTVALAGLIGHLQYVSAEFDLSLNITAIGSSNLVTIVLGQRD